ncbi:FAD-binding oxidoreductase [soil metagenome]
MLKRLKSMTGMTGEDGLPAQRLLTGWGRTAPTLATVSRPTTEADISRLMTASPERGLIARGLGRSYGDPAQNAGGSVLDMTGLNHVHHFDVENGLIGVEAGLSLQQLTSMVLPFGFFLPVSPGTQFVTVGGAIASDIHGKNHHVDGSFCNHVTAIDILTPTGERQTASPEQNAGLFWATAGGMGMTGIILRATLKLPRVETSRIVVDTDRTLDLDEVMRLQQSGDERYQYSVAWVDCIARGSSLGRSILMRGNHAMLQDLKSGERATALSTRPGPGVTAPPFVPPGLLRTSSVKLLNQAWYRKAPCQERDALHTIKQFFYPLDWIGEWNRFHGPLGFLQYQFVVPDTRHDIVRTIIEALADGGWPSSLAVLKRMGPARGPLSFAIPGWTLAVDIPAGIPDLNELLDHFDDLVADAGGRIYLAKDSRMRPELLPVMYPQLMSWRDTVAQIDPQRIMRSDLDRRLRLRAEG